MALATGREMIRSANLKSRRGPEVMLPPLLDSAEVRQRWQGSLTDPESIVVLDLFCGAGGFSYGFVQVEVQGRHPFIVAAGVDIDPVACRTFAANIPARTRVLEITEHTDPRALVAEFGITRVDVIIGDPPCQGFSQAGKAKQKQLNDEQVARMEKRNLLFFQFVRFVKTLRPLVFVMENVQTMGTHSDEINARPIGMHFSPEYHVRPLLLEASAYGVPQARRRLLVVGGLDRVPEWVAPVPSHRPFPVISGPENPMHVSGLPWARTLADAISDLPPREAGFSEDVNRYEEQRRTDLDDCRS